MNTIGKDLRLQALFNNNSNKGLIVAIDHGIEGVPKGLEDLKQEIKDMMEFNITGLLMNPGMFVSIADIFKKKNRPALILSLDMYVNSPGPNENSTGDSYINLASVEDMLKIGADAIKLVLVFGQKDDRAYAYNIESVSKTIWKAHKWGVPVMLELVFWGQHTKDWKNIEKIKHIARVGVELGADILKIPYVGPKSEFVEIVKNSYVPVTVLGGGQTDNVNNLLKEAKDSLDAGAKGLVYGRNVWQGANKNTIIKKLLNITKEYNNIK